MSIKSKIIISAAISALALSGCGGGSGSNGNSGTTTPPPVTDSTSPTVTFNPTSLTVDSTMTGASTLTASDNVSVTSGPTVSCTNGGSFSGSTFTAPTVTAETTSVCTATASDAAGNEGSATLTVTITPPVTTTSPSISGLPALVEATFPEGATETFGNPQIFDITFTDTNSQPTNIRLEGPDADFFQVFVVLTPNATVATMAELALDPSVISLLDFENPVDQGADNIYNFDLVFDYDGETFNIPHEITITNVPEFISLTIGFLDDVNGLGTGQSVPDYSGDGLPEILYANNNVVSSEAIEASKNSNTPFLESLLTTSIDQETFTSDIGKLDVIENPTGGITVLVSQGGIKIFDLNSESDYEILRGNLTGSVDHESLITYERPIDGNTRFVNPRLLGDINGDNLNDIIYSVDLDAGSSPRERSYGIIFGRAATSQTDRTRTLEPDVILNIDPDDFIDLSGGIEINRVPDMDGDGIEELVIDDTIANVVGQTNSRIAEGIFTFVYSTTINSATAPIDVSALGAGEGFQLYSLFGNRSSHDIFTSVASDYDNDGSPSIIISTVGGMLVADADDMTAMQPVSDITTLPNYLSFPNNTLTTATAIGDLDGDGLDEVMYNQGIIAGSDIATHLADGTRTLDVNQVVSFSINKGGNTRVERIVDLLDQGLIALTGFDGTFIVERAELEEAYSDADGIGLNIGD